MAIRINVKTCLVLFPIGIRTFTGGAYNHLFLVENTHENKSMSTDHEYRCKVCTQTSKPSSSVKKRDFP